MAEGSSLKTKTAKGVFWSGVDRFSSQGIQFLFNILIARLLLPEDYGTVAMLNIFIAISQAFIDSGFANALIQKIDRDEDDFNTVFIFNIVLSVFFCALLWCVSPLISSFYGIPMLTKITRVTSLSLVIGALGSIQHTKLSIDINFRTKAVISIISVAVIGAVGLFLAYKGFGIWTLVIQTLVSSTVRTVLGWVFVRWLPNFHFSWKSFKNLFGFGSKLLASSLIDTVWGNVYNIVIGKVINPAALGLYNRASSLATFPSANIFGLVQNVSYPVLCSIQNQRDVLREAFRKFIRLFAFIVFPMMFGLAAVADSFVVVVLTQKWAQIIPLLRILCFSLMWYPLGAMNTSFPNILGRSDIYLRLVIISMILNIIALVITVPMGISAMCYGQIATAIIGYAICTHYTRVLIGYSFFNQFLDFLPSLINSAVMGAVVFFICRMISSDLWSLTSGIIAGVAIYYILARLFQNSELKELYSFVKRK